MNVDRVAGRVLAFLLIGGAGAAVAAAAAKDDARVVSGDSKLDAVLVDNSEALAREFLVSEQPDGKTKPSELYKWPDLLRALRQMHAEGAGPYHFYMGDKSEKADVRWKYGLVNVAAFLAQAMQESIRYDVCDENNWDQAGGYKISSACGQLGEKYADLECADACPRDPNLEITAVTHARWWGAPGPLFCASDRALAEAGVSKDGKTGHWDNRPDCSPYPAAAPDFKLGKEQAFERPECKAYAGQKAGKWVWDGSGDSVEGCCWWGRGVIQTSGRCNMGKLNHFLGHGRLDVATARGWKPPYPDVDFCKTPEAICASEEHPELKWVAGLFFWTTNVQGYDKKGWSYKDHLKAFVDSGLKDPGFIDAVSGIVNRGCHDAPCGGGPVHEADRRRANFEGLIKAFGLAGREVAKR
jgi:hypothetical protein